MLNSKQISSEEVPGVGADQKADTMWLVGGGDFLGIVGFMLYLTYIFLMLMNALVTQAPLSTDTAFLLVFFMLVGDLFARALTWFIAKITSGRLSISFIIVFAVLLPPLPGLSILLGITNVLILQGVWLMSGIGAFFILELWGFFLAGLQHKKANLYPAICVAAESIVLLTMLHLFKEVFLGVIMCIVPLLSVALFFWWSSHPKKVLNKPLSMPIDWKLSLRSNSAMIANGILIGLVIYALSLTSSSLVSVSVLSAMLIAGAFKIYDSLHHQFFEVNRVIQVIAPVAAVGLLLFPYVDVSFYALVLGVIMLVVMVNNIVCWTAISQYMYVYRLSPLANLAYGSLGDVVGFLLGIISGHFIFGSTLEGGVVSSLPLSLIVITTVVLQAFVFYDNYSPLVEHGFHKEDLKDDKPGFPSKGHWKSKCTEFAKYYKLSPRQLEVLLLLAKGYSAVGIEHALFVSSHTAKAHIYNIYRKTDSHSRQDLIEKIEHYKSLDS